MESREKCARVRKVIEHIVQKLVRSGWKLQGGNSLLPVIEKGIERLKALYPYSDMADERIIDFLVYQLYRYRNMIGDYGRGWRLSWCFSDNAVLKYRKQFIDKDGKSGMNWYIDQWLAGGGLDRASLAEMIGEPREHTLAKYVYMEAEEPIKRRWLGTEYGYMVCFRNTTGWSPLSAACRECRHVSECIGYFDKTMPELIRLRKNINEKNND